MKLTLGQVIAKVKRLLKRITGIPENEIFLRQQLREPEFRFDTPDLRALHNRLNDTFDQQELTLIPDQTEAAVTVSDLVELVWDNLDDEFKIEE